MTGVTGTLDVIGPTGVEHYEWNGNVDDRERARAAFNNAKNGGMYLAVVRDSPGKSTQIRNFDEALDREREVGTVAVTVSPALQGG